MQNEKLLLLAKAIVNKKEGNEENHSNNVFHWCALNAH